LARFTHEQGQYLAYIVLYAQLHRRAPSELDIQEYFRVTPPSVHDMILRLAAQGLISREPGQARSIRVLVPHEELPPLD
jgi:Mn-dependent DtxR family transcriptional regulator